jgi:hypothetical protein
MTDPELAPRTAYLMILRDLNVSKCKNLGFNVNQADALTFGMTVIACPEAVAAADPNNCG